MKYLWISITILFLILTPAVFEYADKERGYNSIGSEVLFPMIPVATGITLKALKRDE